MPALAHRTTPTSTAMLLAVLALLASLLSPGAASAQEIVTCEPLLVAHTPVGSEGDETAVAITAQAIDAEAQDLWINVAWEAASSVELTAISVLDSAGRVTELTEELAQGTATDVAGLWFCGSIDSDEPVSDDDEPVDGDPSDPSDVEDTDRTDLDGGEVDDSDDADDVTQPSDPPSVPEPEANTGESGSATSGTSGSTAASAPSSRAELAEEDGQDASDDLAPGDETGDDEEPPIDDTPSTLSEARSADDEVESADTEVADDEVEVLGVQLTQDEGRTGPAWAMLLLVLGLGVLAVGVGVSVWRHWPAR